MSKRVIDVVANNSFTKFLLYTTPENKVKVKMLLKDSVSSKMELTVQDGKTYKTNFYNLDAIISVGYRVNSKRATQFRQWATQIFREFTIKGFVLVDEYLKKLDQLFGFFDKLRWCIRETRRTGFLAMQPCAIGGKIFL